jgi:peptidoglycan/LPS O-acetylase OafA/YrhL
MQYFSRINSLRTFAVFSVLFSHFFNQNITKHLFLGNAGVNLFFVISGFLISKNLIQLKESNETLGKKLKLFYFRRSLRIFPIYYLYLVILFFFFYHSTSGQLSWASLYVFNFFELKYEASKLLIHVWSLSLEEQFYLIWPLLILLIPNPRRITIVYSIIFISIMFKLIFPEINHKLFTFSSFDSFAIGSLFAHLLLKDRLLLIKYLGNKILLYIALIIYAAVIYLSFYEPNLYIENLFRTSTSIISFYLIGLAVFPEKHQKGMFVKILDNKTLIFFGKISYGIYMYHMIVSVILDPYINEVFESLISNQNNWIKYIYFNSYVIKFPLYTSISIFIAYVSFEFIEKPILKLKDRIIFQ